MRFALGLLLLTVACCSTVSCLRPLEPTASSLQEAGQLLRHAADGELTDKPWFCHDLDCPKYTVINKTAGYETREYEKSKWASTQVSGLLYTPSVTAGFKRLFDYISGENSNSTKIPMTAPVATAITPGQGPFCKSNFTVAFYVPSEFQENTPQPNGKEVYLYSSPKFIVYVSQFGGFLVDDLTLSYKVKALKEDLEANGEVFDAGVYFTASYDPPFRVQHRHNEIWFSRKVTETQRA